MALFFCPECDREISDQAKSCPYCGYKLPKPKKELSAKGKKKIKLLVGFFLSIVCIILFFFFFSPHTVEWCCYHHIINATCTEPQKCSRCGKTWGIPLGHIWKDATCTEPKTCTTCQETSGHATGHSWQNATCTTPSTCRVCKKTKGSPIAHSWQPATCTKPRTCSVCGKTEGKKADHIIKDYVCTQCGETFVTASDIPSILDITSLKYHMNSVGGINQYMTFKNRSLTKTINYIYIDLQFYNAVGDLLKSDIAGKTTASLKYTGPLKPGKSSGEVQCNTIFYNTAFSGTIRIKKITIEYSDGTKLVLDESVACYAVVDWRS